MSNPAVSVIIPTFNRKDQCIRAVRSALAQTQPPLEVLVGDDGSTDGTGPAIEELTRSDDRVRYLALPVNTGSPAAARNACLRAARGEWVGFLDDDDEWLPEKLAQQEPALAAGHAIVCANARRSDGGDYFESADSELTFSRGDLLRDNPVIISTAVVERGQLLDAGGFPEDPRLAGVEDHGAWLALADRGATAARLPVVVAIYTAAGGDRLADSLARQRASTTLALRRWIARPLDGALAAATITQSVRALKVWADLRCRRRSTADPSTRS